MKYEHEPVSSKNIAILKTDSDEARGYLCSFGEFNLYTKYINGDLAGDFACLIATLIAEYRREIIELNETINDYRDLTREK